MFFEGFTEIVSFKVDIDELTELALEYEVQSVPVLAVMKNGKIVSSF